jgi:hypothetical protein
MIVSINFTSQSMEEMEGAAHHPQHYRAGLGVSEGNATCCGHTWDLAWGDNVGDATGS